MIISHKHRFIFIKTKKTAGTSIEIALSRFCGPDDVITPITAEDEQLRRELGYRGPQNYLAPLRDHSLRDLARRLRRGVRKRLYYNHISAAEVKARIGDQTWNDYFTFCFERNPWDRVISHYYWRNRGGELPDMDDFIRNSVASLRKRGYLNYTIDGQVAVDRVCRFEELADELESIRRQIGLPEPLQLPRAKGGHRRDRRSYRDVLSPAQRELVGAAFREEIALCGYEY